MNKTFQWVQSACNKSKSSSTHVKYTISMQMKFNCLPNKNYVIIFWIVFFLSKINKSDLCVLQVGPEGRLVSVSGAHTGGLPSDESVLSPLTQLILHPGTNPTRPYGSHSQDCCETAIGDEEPRHNTSPTSSTARRLPRVSHYPEPADSQSHSFSFCRLRWPLHF